MAVVQVLAYDPLSVAVGVEVYGSRWDYANKIRTEALEQSAPAFDAVNSEEDLKGLAEMEEGASGQRECGKGRRVARNACGGEFGLVVVGLQASF